jgi:stage V sporulation protein SpoVS
VSLERSGDLDIAEDMTVQRRSWVAQRAGWAVMLAIVVAAMLGLCGSNGPLNGVSAGAEGGAVSVRYARFLRHMSPATLQVELGAGAVDQGYARLLIAGAYLEQFEIDAVTPEPAWVQLGPEGLIYGFAVAGTGGPLVVSFSLRPDAYGRVSGDIGPPGGERLRLRQFIYP